MAKLEMEMVVVVAAGASFSGNLMLRVHNGRFLLSIKGSLVWGAGLKGYMTFEVGYESVVELLELVRQEMAANRYQDLDWVDGEALAYVRDLSFLGAIGVDVWLGNTVLMPINYFSGASAIRAAVPQPEAFLGGVVEARRIAREDQASIRRTGSHRDAMFIAETKKDAEASFFR